MTVTVHERLTINGRKFKRGDVLFDGDAQAALSNPTFRRRVSTPGHPEHFEHLRGVKSAPEQAAAPAEPVKMTSISRDVPAPPSSGSPAAQ